MSNKYIAIIIINTTYKNISNEKRQWHYDSTKMEKNIWLADQLRFIGWGRLLKSRTLALAPYEFVVASLLFFLFLSLLVES